MPRTLATSCTYILHPAGRVTFVWSDEGKRRMPAAGVLCARVEEDIYFIF